MIFILSTIALTCYTAKNAPILHFLFLQLYILCICPLRMPLNVLCLMSYNCLLNHLYAILRHICHFLTKSYDLIV